MYSAGIGITVFGRPRYRLFEVATPLQTQCLPLYRRVDTFIEHFHVCIVQLIVTAGAESPVQIFDYVTHFRCSLRVYASIRGFTTGIIRKYAVV